MKVDWFGFDVLCAEKQIRTAHRSRFNRKSLLTLTLDAAQRFADAGKRELAWHFLRLAKRIRA